MAEAEQHRLELEQPGEEHHTPGGWAADMVLAQTQPPEVQNAAPVSPAVFQGVLTDLVKNHIATNQLVDAARDLNQSQPGESFNNAMFRLFREHIEDAFKEQSTLRAQGKDAPLLGQILVNEGWATQNQVDRAMQAQDQIKANPSIPKENVPKIGQLMSEQLELSVHNTWQTEWHKFNLENANHL